VESAGIRIVDAIDDPSRCRVPVQVAVAVKVHDHD
jgi:hypothetical protein